MRHPSEQALDLLKSIERTSLTPYDDQTGEEIDEWCKGATIGTGHLIRQGEWSKYRDGITEEQAEELYANDAIPMIQEVDENTPDTLTQNEFDACVILTFNIGRGEHGFSGSSVAKILNGEPSHYANIDDAWMAWNKSQGEVNEGLINRRMCELKIYHEGIYEQW